MSHQHKPRNYNVRSTGDLEVYSSTFNGSFETLFSLHIDSPPVLSTTRIEHISDQDETRGNTFLPPPSSERHPQNALEVGSPTIYEPN